MEYYGPYSIVLLEISIEDRASVFEENPFLFNKRHNVIAGTSPPPGYRAPWRQRADVAVAKLHGKLTAGMTAPDFTNILMEQRRDQADCDFVEVHVFGPINRAGIAKVSGPKPKRPADVVLWNKAKRSLRSLGAVVVEQTP